MERVPELDGLRGAAISMVLLYHYLQLTIQVQHGSLLDYVQRSLALGWTGVDLFFVLSGFLIGGILLDARNSSNFFRVFYTRRFFRIIPLYIVALVVFPAIVSIARWTNHGDFRWLTTGNTLPWWSYWTFTQNFWMASTGRLGVLTLAVTWSLAVEEQFYMTLPFFVRFLTAPQFKNFVILGIAIAPLLRIILGKFHCNWIVSWALMPCRMDALLMGVMAAMLLRDGLWKGRLQRSRNWLLSLVIFLLGGMVVFTVYTPSVGSSVMQRFGFTWTALFYTSILLYALTQPSSILSKVLRFSWLGWLGGLAYGIYLLHELILGMVFGVFGVQEPFVNGWSSLLTTSAALLITILLADFSWSYFEEPLVNWRRVAYVQSLRDSYLEALRLTVE